MFGEIKMFIVPV